MKIGLRFSKALQAYVDRRTTGTIGHYDQLGSQCFWETQTWTGPGLSVHLIFCRRNGLTFRVAAGRGCRWQLDKNALVREQGTSTAAPRYCHDSAGASWPRRLNTRPAERERESFSTQKQLNSREMTGALP